MAAAPQDGDFYGEYVEHKRAMFGDAFGSRGDYSRGIFYGGRRKVLASPLKKAAKPKTAASDLGLENNALELPEMFMSRSQTRKHRNGTKGIQFKLAFTDTKAEGEGGGKPSKNAVKKQEDKKMKMKRMLYLDRYSSTRREDWVEVDQAGCHFYTNHTTGEATVEKPYEAADLPPGGLLPPITMSPIKEAQSGTTTRPLSGQSEGDFKVEGEGTGAYVYDSSELTSFLSILDEHCAEQKRKDAARAEAEEAKRIAKAASKYQRHI